MAYASINFPTKAALKRAVASGLAPIRIRPTSIVRAPEESADYTGVAFLEGPWYPRPHTWYAKVQVTSGTINKVLS